MNGYRVHLHGRYDEAFIRGLTARLNPGIVLSHDASGNSHRETRIVIAGRPPRELLDSCEALESLIIPWAGLPAATAALMRDFPRVRVWNIHHNAGAASEMAITLMMAAARNLIPAHRALAMGDWSIRYTPDQSVLVEGSHVTILGMGSIGRRVADVCRGMGADVRGVKRHAGPEEETQGIYPPCMLHDLLPDTDILIVCLPLTPETSGMIGDEELTLLPAHSVLVNVARGEIVSEEPLYRHLESGSIGAAGIDVWYRYPENEEERSETPPSDYPFGELRNVVMSPHRGGAFGVGRLEELRALHLAAAVNALSDGDEPSGRIDLDLGY